MTISIDRPTVPELSAQAQAALPVRRALELRWLAGAGAAAVTVAGVVMTWDSMDLNSDRGTTAVRLAVWLAPWALALPWLKKLDIRPVPWFFLSMFLGVLVAPWLAAKIAYRSTSLPYRDWSIDYWHEHRARLVPSEKAIVLVAGDSVAPPVLPGWLVRLEAVQRVGWSLVIAVMIPGMVFEDLFPTWAGATLFGTVAGLSASHVLVATLLSPRWRRWTKQRRLT